jgi:hypothetical protein
VTLVAFLGAISTILNSVKLAAQGFRQVKARIASGEAL